MLLTSAIFVGTYTLCAFAQRPPNNANAPAAPQGEVRQEVRIERHGNMEAHLPPGGGDFNFVFSEMNFDGKPVTNAPYSAEAVSESTQTLADGNRIVHKTTTSIARDSQGRTRREQKFNAVGAYAVAGDTPQIVSISDPVAGTRYLLDARSKTARKLPVMHFNFNGKPGTHVETRNNVVIIEQHDSKAGDKPVAPLPPAPPMGAPHEFFYRTQNGKHDPPKVEELGTQSIEGVQATGKRTTHTIPVGAIGNEQPIKVVDERWYSNELQTVVLSKHTDPRFGETNYRLMNINRSEPAATLFQVPTDYTVKEIGGNARQMRKHIEEKQ
ncbi:MAG: hypothetical protein NVSMB56_04100 [Pyrinomonadaceae bacterium]